MEFEDFVNAINSALLRGMDFDNPGGGTSLIESITDQVITYKRGNSNISVSLEDLYSAFLRFRGRQTTTSELKKFSPSVFDSAARPAGHSCNCTFLFQVLNAIGHAGEIEGSGVKGDPFSARIV